MLIEAVFVIDQAELSIHTTCGAAFFHPGAHVESKMAGGAPPKILPVILTTQSNPYGRI
jgi:hypothetical protein